MFMKISEIIREEYRNIHNENFLNEGWRENLLTGLMLLTGVVGADAAGKVTAKSQDKIITIPLGKGKKITKTLTNVTQDAQSMENMLRRSWELDSVVLDTIWHTAQLVDEIKVDSISIVTGTMDGNFQYFNPGTFDLTNQFKNIIKNGINSLEGKSLLNIRIEASTDKQQLLPATKNRLKNSGYEETNAGLAQARANTIKNYLISELGVDSNSIVLELKPEQGSGTSDEYASGMYRYINLDVTFLDIPDIGDFTIPQTPPTYDVNKTYHMHKDMEISKKREITIKIPGFKLKKCKISLFKGSSRQKIKCPTW